LRPFVPLVRNPHLLTIAGNFWPRDLDQQRFPVAAKLYETDPGVQVLVHTQRPTTVQPVAQLVMVHGLEGSSESGYARSLAQAALRGRLRRASFQHAQLRRHRAPERPILVSFRPDFRPARGHLY
jgi:predicted alpha/beta-fold hydrolase